MDATRGGAAAEVQGDEVGGGGALVQVCGYRARDEGVGEAVEAVFAQRVLGGCFLVDGVCLDGFGDLCRVSVGD